MSTAAMIAIGFVALLHTAFLVLEMFLWTSPYGRRVFGNSPEEARASATLAANQGLYNGFLAAGLVWSLTGPANAGSIAIFFLSCVMVAGIYGALTAKRTILFVQFLPAAIAFALVMLS